MAAIRICSGGIACCKSAFSRADHRLYTGTAGAGLLREMEPDMQGINAFQLRYSAFSAEEGVTGCIDAAIVNKDEMNEAETGRRATINGRMARFIVSQIKRSRHRIC